MTLTCRERFISTRGQNAILFGERLYGDWTKEEIVTRVKEIKSLNSPCPNIDADRLECIPEDILRRTLLLRSSWHHVNRKPQWFYVPDHAWIAEMRNADIDDMQNDALWFEEIENRPRLAEFCLYTWKTSTTGHQYCTRALRTGICLNGIAYFENGFRQEIRKDHCEAVTVYAKTPKHLRKKYDAIRKRMRRFEVYC